MTDDERRIDIASADLLQQGTHVFMHMRLSHFQSQTFGERDAKRKLDGKTRVITRDRDCAILSAGVNGLSKRMQAVGVENDCVLGAIIDGNGWCAVIFHTDSVDARV